MEPRSEDRKENHDLGCHEEKKPERQQSLYFQGMVPNHDAFHGHVTESNSYDCNRSQKGQQ